MYNKKWKTQKNEIEHYSILFYIALSVLTVADIWEKLTSVFNFDWSCFITASVCVTTLQIALVEDNACCG